MAPDVIKRLIEAGEGQRLEFKQTFASQNEAIESLVAFSNAAGGTVIIGVKNNGDLGGVSIGQNTLETFANRIKANTDPPLTPKINPVVVDERELVLATVPQRDSGEFFMAFGRPLIRVGRTNQIMSVEQIRKFLLETVNEWSEEKDRPRFEITGGSTSRTERGIELIRGLKKVSGNYVADLQWRFRGPLSNMDWQSTTEYALERSGIKGSFNPNKVAEEDELIGENEIGVEIRFYWRGKWRHELHRWPVQSNLDVGREILPPLYFER